MPKSGVPILTNTALLKMVSCRPPGRTIRKRARHASQAPGDHKTSVRQASKPLCFLRKSKKMPHRVIKGSTRGCGGAKKQGPALCLAPDGSLHHYGSKTCIHKLPIMIVCVWVEIARAYARRRRVVAAVIRAGVDHRLLFR